MDRDEAKLIILNFNYNLYNYSKLIGTILAFLILILSALLIALAEIENNILFFFLIVCPFLIYLYLYSHWVKKRVFREIAYLRLSKNKLFVKDKSSPTITFKKQDIDFINFSYKGDNIWHGRRRYKVERESAESYQNSLDFIEINKTKYYIKIVNQSDKINFFSIIDWAKANEIPLKNIWNSEP